MAGHLLSLIIFLPLLGVLLLLFIRDERALRWVALAAAAADLALTIPLLSGFDNSTHNMQFVERYEWIPSWNVFYYLGIDGISVLFIFLTAFLGVICVLASWNAIQKKVKEFMISLLVMQTAMLGVFASLDMFLFYLFWEAMLIPMYLLIGIWGGANRIYSAIKFFIYTLAGSILMLVGMIALYYAGGGTLDIPALMQTKYSFAFQAWVFIAFFIAFAVKVPMFPFHTWLPDAHVDAPTAGSIILAGVMLKMGTYGFLRFSIPMFPDASRYFATPIVIISLVAIIYGAFLALAQKDLKKLIAYSSISHMGFITMGLFLFNKNGVEGAILQMFNHGITTGALFLCVGIIYERTHTRDIGDYGWAASRVPFYATFLFIFSIASLGFPGTNGFIGELLIAFGAFEAYKPYLIFLLIGIVFGAAYMLWMFKRMAYGADTHGHGGHGHGGDDHGHKVWDIDFREALALAAFIVFVFWVGFHPEDFLGYMHESVSNLISQAKANKLLVSGF
ncbi:MAG TPA: NADH-quinone oxidoreductase subunit M [Deltaproteobacteria bacterium]|nr:MAG: NADH-quinone oxidoreductase subunit M [Deltaproteobacteria bacterium GWA2_55_82]OGQ64185.1 MAG: NADH-quinone oxidoreductase subunit M [Deltaproteobacteria bacterium RIFCSPLOWO2_02_FULL_55_12]OIJ74639.1 MAG: NADH-quinone oxidoreductase subunit M [Deltaproteobacteria bacterium GWC2_55_46]HBG46415.1 NADH-quinone oxidoreductase subunit M [Deltaproteobacteria bacterium]HCY10627.1 NADH-quinone oxidoreductase subunit M [Deltaproteobacteria bacterium]